MKVELLKRAEIPLLFPIGHAFTAEAERPPFNEEAFLAAWQMQLDLDIARIYVIKDGGQVVACLGAFFSQDFFTGRSSAAECFWYVLPHYRRSGAGIDLLDTFEADAKARGCTQLMMVHFVHVGAEVLQKIYERRGYKLVEQSYQKEI